MAQSFIIYTLLLSILIFCGWAYQSKKSIEIDFLNPFIVTIILSYTFICGMRFDVGVDYPIYLETFIDLRNYGISFFAVTLKSEYIGL